MLHRASGTLIVGDLVFNMRTERDRWTTFFFRYLAGTFGRVGMSRMFPADDPGSPRLSAIDRPGAGVGFRPPDHRPRGDRGSRREGGGAGRGGGRDRGGGGADAA